MAKLARSESLETTRRSAADRLLAAVCAHPWHVRGHGALRHARDQRGSLPIRGEDRGRGGACRRNPAKRPRGRGKN
jgi:hypothetical protein